MPAACAQSALRAAAPSSKRVSAPSSRLRAARRASGPASARNLARAPRGVSDAGDWACPLNGCSVSDLRAKRLITAIKTPYLASGKVDLFAYDALVEQQIAGGVEGLIVGGTTGEGQLMSWDEHIMLIAHTAQRYGGKVKVIGNTGSNSTREAVHATQQGFAVGMDASLQINPYYGKTSRAGLLEHFEAVMDLGPAIVYNVPARTSQDIVPDVMFELAKHANFAGVKECEGNARIKQYTDNGVTCWTGNDDECHDARYDAGAVGVISVTSNLVPELMREMLFDGPNPELRDRLLPLMNWLFAEPNPTGINTACAMLGVAQPVFRLPYVPYAAALRAQGAEHLRAVGLDAVVGDGAIRDLSDADFTILRDCLSPSAARRHRATPSRTRVISALNTSHDTVSMMHARALTFTRAVGGDRRAMRAEHKKPAAGRIRAVTRASGEDDEIALLEKALKMAKTRKANGEASAAPAAPAAGGAYSGSSFNVKTFNAISPVGLNKFPKGKYAVSGDDKELPGDPMAMMLRSHKLQVSEVPSTVRGIVRCGAGTNNIPVKEMSELGIPVFNTPGANANAVKELVVCSLLLASRGIIEGNKHVNDVINVEENGDYAKISVRIEKDKAMFGGTEIEGKTLGVIGLGAIGSRVVNAALGLGMNVIGYDPVLSLEAAWRLPGDKMSRADDLDELFALADYITIHVPYIKGVTHHLIDAKALAKCKPGVNLLNFARGEIIDGSAVRAGYDAGKLTGKYVSDFSDPDLMGHPRHIVLPHLGASTEEAEENSAAMAADTMMDFLETGTIRNSVNFPTTILPPHKNSSGARLCIVNKNESGALGEITTFLGTQNCNILQQINTSRDSVAYTVIDLETCPEDPGALQDSLAAACPMVISSRFIGSVFNDELGQPGTYFWVRENGN